MPVVRDSNPPGWARGFLAWSLPAWTFVFSRALPGSLWPERRRETPGHRTWRGACGSSSRPGHRASSFRRAGLRSQKVYTDHKFPACSPGASRAAALGPQRGGKGLPVPAAAPGPAHRGPAARAPGRCPGDQEAGPNQSGREARRRSGGNGKIKQHRGAGAAASGPLRPVRPDVEGGSKCRGHHSLEMFL